jgi:hypothetical protein
MNLSAHNHDERRSARRLFVTANDFTFGAFFLRPQALRLALGRRGEPPGLHYPARRKWSPTRVRFGIAIVAPGSIFGRCWHAQLSGGRCTARGPDR